MLTLRPANAEDADLLWRWVNDPAVRASAFSPDPIPWEGHVTWFQRRLQDDGCRIFIAHDAEGSPVGQIRFDLHDNGRAQIDVSLAAEHRGRGLASELITSGLASYWAQGGNSQVDAWVREENTASRRSFERAGFTLQDASGVGEVAAVRYGIERNDD